MTIPWKVLIQIIFVSKIIAKHTMKEVFKPLCDIQYSILHLIRFHLQSHYSLFFRIKQQNRENAAWKRGKPNERFHRARTRAIHRAARLWQPPQPANQGAAVATQPRATGHAFSTTTAAYLPFGSGVMSVSISSTPSSAAAAAVSSSMSPIDAILLARSPSSSS